MHRPLCSAVAVLLTLSTAVLGANAASPAGLSEADLQALRARGEREGWTFTIRESEATQRPLEELCGLVEPERWWEGANFDPCPQLRALPASFDWRTNGGCPPVRNQGGCGSCWAFATMGALECNILLRNHYTVDLSEQWLVSCNQNGWGCGGGWWAHDYHMWKTDTCGGTGAVPETSFPYVASDAVCRCPYPHRYLIDNWAYIGYSGGIPSTNSIKQAILTYGPVTVGVSVTSAFHAYGGGVFNSCTSGALIHGVVLVGWDDNQGPGGVWFMRNSWGPTWGEGGYMRIPYGCTSIGYAASYVDFPVRDCNDNSVIDPCETDCAAYGGDCQSVAGCGTAADCNGNQRPDTCDVQTADCNNNSLPDDCDAAALFLADPQDTTVCPGATAVFSVTASKPSVTYRWSKDGVPLLDNLRCAGAFTSALYLNDVQAVDAGAYTCTLTDGCIVGASAPATLGLLTVASVLDQPIPRVVCAGGDASFAVTAGGTPPFSYDWRRNGESIGALNSRFLVLPDATLDDEGDYTCVVSNACGSAESSVARLNITGPVFTVEPRERCGAPGASVTLVADAAADATIYWAWR